MFQFVTSFCVLMPSRRFTSGTPFWCKQKVVSHATKTAVELEMKRKNKQNIQLAGGRKKRLFFHPPAISEFVASHVMRVGISDVILCTHEQEVETAPHHSHSNRTTQREWCSKNANELETTRMLRNALPTIPQPINWKQRNLSQATGLQDQPAHGINSALYRAE